MKAFSSALKLLSPVFFLVAGLHLALGAGSEVLLGANLSAVSLADPVLDSQNRFYGVVFALYGVILYMGATNPARYAPVLRAAFWVFFAGGLARLVSIAVMGVPSLPVLLLLAMELVIPPVLLIWLSKIEPVAS
jgi:hypothetical protein